MITTIAGYQVHEVIYESTNSLVLRGHWEADNKPVILKMLKQAYPSPEKIAWFTREYELTRDLNLPGVVDVYSLTMDQHPPVMALEDFGGTSLDLLLRAAPFTNGDFLPLAIRIVDILEQVHQCHVMHKDINPSNIVLNPATGEVKIIDFGISAVLTRENPTLRNPSMLEGTLAYVSPEQTGRMNRAMDYRTDFYSLGVTFYELLTQQLPFSTTDAMELVHAHIARHPIPPHVLVPTIAQPLSAIVMKLMAKNAEDRYQSAYGLKRDLEECLRQWQATGQMDPFPLGRYDVTDRFHIPQKLYGRDAELDVLLSAFERVSQGACEMVLVSGYAGIGKSALVQEMYKPITRQRGYFVSGKFDQFQRNIPYASLTQALRALMRQLLTESENQIASWRANFLTALGLNGQVIIDVIPEVELIIGPQPAVPALPPAEAQNRFHFTFQSFLRVFPKPEHPLVLFLDDLQWADVASLQLLQNLMTATDNQYLFVIGAYRDNEVSKAHGLTLALGEIQDAGSIVHHIALNPLGLGHVQQLMSDTLDCVSEYSKPLAELVLAKTNGNPFFISEFLKFLATEELLTFDVHRQGWQWDLACIEAEGMTDNVVELMVGKVQKLGEKTQQVLMLAACIGNQFNIQTLASLYEHALPMTATSLWEALVEGLVVPLEDAYKLMDLDVQGLDEAITVDYKFTHDRIQQAAYSLLSDTEKQVVHWRLGWLLLQNTPTDEREQQLFAIVNHLNRALPCINRQEERDQVVSLNMLAGKKAKAAAAYASAVDYLEVGVGLLGAESWHGQYDQTLALYVEAAEAAYLSGDIERMEHLVAIVLQQAKTLLDKVKVYEISLHAYVAQHKPQEGLRTGRQVLALLGTRLPQRPSQKDGMQALEETKRLLAGKRIEELIDLPEMTDPHALATMRILSKMTHFTYVASPKLFPCVVSHMVNLSVTCGNTPLSARAYATYGLILCGIIGDIEAGYQFGQLALRLVEQLQARALKATTTFLVNQFVRHWKEHSRTTFASDLEGYQIGLETGDLNYAVFNAFSYLFKAFWAGKVLAGLEQEMAHYNEDIANFKQSHVLNLSTLYRQAVLNLLGQAENPCRLIGESYDEEAMLPLRLAANDRNSLGFLFGLQLVLCYLFHEYDQAVERAAMAEEYLDSVVGTMAVPLFYLYDSLARLAVCPEVEGIERQGILEKVTANQDKMRVWARHAPMNYLHKFYLVEAERARILGNESEAREYYDRAIDLAREHEYINEEALGNELAAKFYLARGQTRVAYHYLRDAHYAYQQWGALAKVKDIEARYPQLLARTEPTPLQAFIHTSPVSSGQTLSSALDFTSVLKAAQAISSEIVLDKLLDRLMHTVIENAGAQRGFLILKKEGALVIEAEKVVHKAEVVTFQSIPIETRYDLPVTLIRYVERTQESVVLNDARQDGQFTSDPYIATQSPKSILCIPWLNQGSLSGMLYLENTLTHDAFTPERLEVLKVLSSQAAIAIENAQLYSTLEQRVAERTQELWHKNEELEKTRLAAEDANHAKSAFLANMSHEIRTPLNAILGYANILGRDPDLNAQQIVAVNTIAGSGQHLLGLIDDILDISKIEAGRMELQESDFVLAVFIDGIAKMFEGRCQEKGLAWHVEWHVDGRPQRDNEPPLSLVVRGDEGKLRQIFINLLSNAVKFTESGDVMLRIDMTHITESVVHVTFHVIDTGNGITEWDQTKIFGAFNRAASVEQQEGTGLGLSIAQKQVELMGGHLDVESKTGSGSRFFFSLSFGLASAQVTEVGVKPPSVIHLAEGFSINALIVDDVEDNRVVLAHMLQMIGVNVVTAEDGLQALKYVSLDRPDIVFVDIRMPKMDGLSVAQQIIETYGQERPKLVAVSASALHHEREHYFAAGFDEFISKPIVPHQVYKCLECLLLVEFVSETSEAAIHEAFATALPEALYLNIKQAAETYRVSQLDRYFNAVASLGPSGQQLAELLHERKQNGDMHGILALLARLQQVG